MREVQHLVWCNRNTLTTRTADSRGARERTTLARPSHIERHTGHDPERGHEKMAIPVSHPDTIPGLDSDCRRVLREAYISIQAAMQRPEAQYDRALSEVEVWVEEIEKWETQCVYLERDEVKRRHIARRIFEYREVAESWGVDVG